MSKIELSLDRDCDKANDDDDYLDFESLIVKKVHDKKAKHQHSKLENIKVKYKHSISRNLNTDDIKDNFIDLAKFSVIFVEKYGFKIAEVISTVLTSDFKLATCIALMREFITESDFNDDFLTNIINALVSLIFNVSVVLPEKDSKKKTDITSIASLPVLDETRKLKRSKSFSGKRVRFFGSN
jgi:hypothetical protein